MAERQSKTFETLVAESQLFSEHYYLARNPDVRRSVLNGRIPSGLTHFLRFGSREGRSPNWAFNESYIQKKEQLTVDHGKYTSLFHMYLLGLLPLERYSPIFNATWYAYKFLNKDKSKSAENDPLKHYMTIGCLQGNSPNEYFDELWYRQTYANIIGSDYNTGIEHYVLEGKKAGLNPNVFFDESYYRNTYSDIHEAIANQKLQCGADHFFREGYAEGRNPHRLFDLKWYYAHYEKEILSSAYDNPLSYYLQVGIKEDQVCHPCLVTNQVEGSELHDLLKKMPAASSIVKMMDSIPDMLAKENFLIYLNTYHRKLMSLRSAIYKNNSRDRETIKMMNSQVSKQ